MKKHLKLITVFGIIAGLLVFAGILAALSPVFVKRAPAAAIEPAGKTRVLAGQYRGKRSHSHGKTNGLFEVAIEAPGKGAVTAGTSINLEATVVAKADLQDMKYVWIIPKEGITVTGGAIEGDLGSFYAGDDKMIRLTLSNDTNENRQVHLHVYRVVNGENMGYMAQYNTVDQEAIDETARTKAEMLAAEAELLGNENARKLHH